MIFISYCLRNCNTVEFLGIWEGVYNSSFNYGMTTFYSEKRSQKINKKGNIVDRGVKNDTVYWEK